MKKALRAAGDLTKIVWNKYVLRKPPAQPVTKQGVTVSQAYLDSYGSIRKLIDAQLMDIDLDTPRVFVSFNVYQAFLRPVGATEWVDGNAESDMAQARLDSLQMRMDKGSESALAFLDKVRFYINMSRHYVAGLRSWDAEGDGKTEDVTPEYAPEWIGLFVATRDEKDIMLAGRWKDDAVELKPVMQDMVNN